MKSEKLQRGIFYLLLVLLPTQLGLHFWLQWSYISGIRIDYLSPTLYLTDILILGLFLLWLWDWLPGKKYYVLRIKYYGKIYLFLALLVLLALLNVYFSLSPYISLYKWLKVAELGFLVWFVVRRVPTNPLSYLPTVLLVPMFYESVLAVWQFFSQASVGGWWYWLGERTFNNVTPGIANAYINGQLILRPYGTFPHPNVLGGFLAVVLPLVLWQFLHNSRKLTARTLGILSVVILGYTTLFLTMSRAAILVGLAATLMVLGQKLGRRKVWLGILGSLALLGIVLWPRFAALNIEAETVVARQQLNGVAIEQFVRSPIFGTGLGTAPLYGGISNFIHQIGGSNYALAFQPPHNIYLLLLAETGILGLLGVLGILGRALKNGATRVPLLTILFLGLFDHYFLTLQQGQLIFSLILGLSLGTRQKRGKLLA